jgi:hypothetical protein
MAWEVWKDVLYPQRCRLADGRVIEYAPEDSQHVARRVKEMLAASINIPMCWEHQPDAVPLTPWEKAARMCKETFAEIRDSEVTPSGVARVKIAGEDDEDLKRLRKVKYCSPGFVHDLTTGDGRHWPGRSMIHLAATPRPVQAGQKPYEPLSLAYKGAPELLSLEGYDVAEETKSDGGAGGEIGDLIKALRDAGLNIPDGVEDIPHLITALKAQSPAGDAPDADDAAVAEEAAPVMMSLQADLASLKRENALMKNHMLAAERAKLVGRVKAANIPAKAKRDELLRRAQTEQLSLTPAGELERSPLVIEVAVWEEAGKASRAAFFPPEHLSQSAGGAAEVPLPDGYDAEAAKKQARERGAARAKRISRAS